MGVSLLGYRPWKEELRGSWASVLPIARIALRMVFRRKLFWGLYVFGLLNFFVFFSGIYLLSQIDVQDLGAAGKQQARLFFIPIGSVGQLVHTLKDQLHLAGNADTFRNFFWYQGYIVMAILAMAGSILIGNDYQHGSLAFYLSKPLGRWHYLAGKFLATALFINMMTTLPALLLFVQCGMLTDWSYFSDNARLFWGILGYGATLTVCLSPLVIATASWLRKTVPMIMAWVGLLLFCRVFAVFLVDNLHYDKSWRLIDIWNSMYVVGSECLGTVAKIGGGKNVRLQPELWEVSLVLTLVGISCLIYLARRIRAVEIIR